MRHIILIFTLLASLTLFAHARNLNFAPDISAATWEASGNKEFCEMKQQIPEYGEVTLIRRSGKTIRFEVNSWEEVLEPTAATVAILPPAWRHQDQGRVVSQPTLKTGIHILSLPTTPTLQILSALNSGMSISLRYTPQKGQQQPIEVTAFPIHFQEAYSKYLTCTRDLYPVGYIDIEHLTLHFNSDSYDLSKESKAEMDKVFLYKKVGGTFSKIFFTGHADGRGSVAYNRRLATFRAEAARKYMLVVGHLDPDMLIVNPSVIASKEQMHALGKDKAALVKFRRVDIEVQK